MGWFKSNPFFHPYAQSKQDVSSQVHIMAYMIDPIVEAYEILLMCSLSFDVVAYCPLDKYMPCGRQESLIGIMHTEVPKHFVNICTWLRPNNLNDLSL